MEQYQRLVRRVLENGEERHDRTGTGTIELYSERFVHNMADGFPLLTTKKLHLKSIIHELLFFIAGKTNNNELTKNGVTIWNEWAKEDGELGPIYGSQWRRWTTVDAYGNTVVVDQLAELINKIKHNPTDRRMLVTAWHPGQIKDMALPPCHWSFETYVHNNGTLDLTWNQRSNDLGLGTPFNIASYALLLMMICEVTGKKPGRLIGNFGCTHIYKNHIDALRMQLERVPYKLPTMIIKHRDNIDDFVYEDFELVNYACHPHIKMEVSV